MAPLRSGRAFANANGTVTLRASYERHLVVYLHLLHAAAENANDEEMTRIVLRIDPTKERSAPARRWTATSAAPAG